MKNRKRIIKELEIISEIVSKAKEYGLLIEVIYTAINIAKLNPELSVSEIITESKFQFDI